MKVNEYRRTALIAMTLALLGAASVAATVVLIDESGPGFWERNKQHIIAAEVALFSIIVVEVVGRAILQRFRQAHALQAGIAVRAVLRVVAYLVMSVRW